MDYRYSTTNDGARDPEFQYRSVEILTRFLVGLLIASAVLSVVAAISAGLQLQLLGAQFTHEQATANDVRERLVALGATTVQLVTVVVFAVWIVRAHRNLPALGAEDLDVTPGWALGWFIVPIASFWKPYTAMRTLWKASHDGPRWEVEDVPAWMTLWWVLWLVGMVFGRLILSQLSQANTLDGLIVMTKTSLASDGANLVLDGIAALLVLRIWRAQEAQFEARSATAIIAT